MPTQKEMMQSAKAYIKLKQYDDARRILEQVDHPAAKAWLTKINHIAPPKPTPHPLVKIGIAMAHLTLAVTVATLAMMLLDASGWWEFNLGTTIEARRQSENIMLGLWVVIAGCVLGASIYYMRKWEQRR